MYSSEDLERFYVEYQSEWVPRGMTMRAFCDRNNVPYRVMENFVSNIRKKIVEVEVTGCPPGAESARPTTDATTGPEKPTHRMVMSKKITTFASQFPMLNASCSEDPATMIN